MIILLQHIAAYSILFILIGFVVHFLLGEGAPWYAGHATLALGLVMVTVGVVVITAFGWAVTVIFG